MFAKLFPNSSPGVIIIELLHAKIQCRRTLQIFKVRTVVAKDQQLYFAAMRYFLESYCILHDICASSKGITGYQPRCKCALHL